MKPKPLITRISSTNDIFSMIIREISGRFLNIRFKRLIQK